MNPIDYSIDVKQPFETAMQGYQAGVGINQMAQKQQQQELALKQQQQLQIDLAKLAGNKNATGQDYASMMTMYPKLSEHFKRGWDVLNGTQQQSKLSQATQVYSALHAGKPEIASQLLNDQAAALRNSGMEQDAKAAETMAKFIEMDPQSAKTTSGLMLSSIMGPDKFATTFQTLGDQQRAAEKAPADKAKAEAEAKIKGVEAGNATEAAALSNANISSQIKERAARLTLDQDKLTSEVGIKLTELNQKATTLTDDAKKIVNESTTNSVVADQGAAQMLDLAGRLDKEDPSSGLYGKGKELVKNLSGNQNAITSMRQEYVRLRNTQAIKMLPPGPATDKDIALALKGFPDDTADAAVMSSFLRGMAKLQQREAVAENAKAEWVNAVGHMGKPKTDIEVDGVKVPAGSTYTDFARQFLKTKTDQRATQQADEQKTQQLQGRSYMRFAQPPSGGASGNW